MTRDAAGELHTYGGLFLGLRLRRLSERLHAGLDEVYRAHGVTIPSGTLALLMLLRDHGAPLSIGELARKMGQSHVAISRVSRPLSAEGLTAEVGHERDGRRVLLLLLPKGQALLERLEPLQAAIVAAVDEMAPGGLMASLRAIEEELELEDFATRVAARQKNKRRNRSRAV